MGLDKYSLSVPYVKNTSHRLQQHVFRAFISNFILMMFD